MESDETLQEARSQRPLPILCFSGRSKKQDGRSGLWLAEIFSTSPLKPLNGIQRNLTGSKISTSSIKFVFFGPIGKTRWPPWPLIGWDIFDFSSETTEKNSTKLDRNVLYQDLNVWTEFYQVSILFFGPIGKTRWPPWPLIGWDIFDFSSETTERNSTKLDRKQDLNVLYQICVFRADRKNKMAALASHWLRHFRLLLWNHWKKFYETWQEARSQRPLSSLCFSGRSENKMAALASHWLRHFQLLLWNHWKKFYETWQEARSQRPLSSLCFFRADRKNKMAALASDWLRHFQLLFWKVLENEFVLEKSLNLGDLPWNFKLVVLDFLFCIFWTESLNGHSKWRGTRANFPQKKFSSLRSQQLTASSSLAHL